MNANGPAFDAEQEVRFALVLYGGVSLAIYLYGVAEEFLHLVRATAPDRRDPERRDGRGSSRFRSRGAPNPSTASSGSMLPLGGASSGRRAGADAVRRRRHLRHLGGRDQRRLPREGACERHELAGLKNLWLNDGDIAVLVNDRPSAVDVDADGRRDADATGLAPDFEPDSLLNSDRMLRAGSVSALGHRWTRPDRERNARRWWTSSTCTSPTTDLDGNLLADPALERGHVGAPLREPLPLQGRPARTSATTSRPSNNPFLAFASRCTSAFPFAFQPMTLQHLEEFEARPSICRTTGRSSSMPTYDSRTTSSARKFSDGGILDNKPFSYATGSLVCRRAPLPVDRKLIYVEPDPASRRRGGRAGQGLERAPDGAGARCCRSRASRASAPTSRRC